MLQWGNRTGLRSPWIIEFVLRWRCSSPIEVWWTCYKLIVTRVKLIHVIAPKRNTKERRLAEGFPFIYWRTSEPWHQGEIKQGGWWSSASRYPKNGSTLGWSRFFQAVISRWSRWTLVFKLHSGQNEGVTYSIELQLDKALCPLWDAHSSQILNCYLVRNRSVSRWNQHRIKEP